jgi:endonuclease/exonuclease/phosphatase family metal-dependent hydrolase
MPFVFVTLGLILFLAVLRSYTAKNYLDPIHPFYAGSYTEENQRTVESLTVASYNIWFGLDLKQALAELKELQTRRPLDIILLQEMDELGTEQIARILQLNYVYYPAAIEPTYHKNFGNAVLTRWSILDSKKLILPHRSFSNRMNRIATRATIRIHDVDVLVYSIHTESIFTLPRFREDQYRAVLEDTGREAERVIIGGDFNSFRGSDVKKTDSIFREAGYLRASEACGHTILKYGIGVLSDHIFTKGFVVKETGKIDGATASDHLPIWVTLTPE